MKKHIYKSLFLLPVFVMLVGCKPNIIKCEFIQCKEFDVNSLNNKLEELDIIYDKNGEYEYYTEYYFPYNYDLTYSYVNTLAFNKTDQFNTSEKARVFCYQKEGKYIDLLDLKLTKDTTFYFFK